MLYTCVGFDGFGIVFSTYVKKKNFYMRIILIVVYRATNCIFDFSFKHKYIKKSVIYIYNFEDMNFNFLPTYAIITILRTL